MGKPSKRPGRESRDIHAAIRDEAAYVRSLPTGGESDAETWPALAELLTACRAQITGDVQRTIEFKGRRYYLTVRLAMSIDIFDSPGAAEPLFRGAVLSEESFGHAPGH